LLGIELKPQAIDFFEPTTGHEQMSKGTLYLVPTPLDFGTHSEMPLNAWLPEETILKASQITHWVCENAKSSRAFLKRVGQVHPLQKPIQEHILLELSHAVHKKGDHQGHSESRELLSNALLGHDIGLLSEAGMPAIADPGSSVVRAAHHLGIKVKPLVGPISLTLALAASGMNGQNFSFVGYLPQAPEAKIDRIKYLDQWIKKSGQTQILIETPYRNASLLATFLNVLHPQTRLCVASGLGLKTEWIESHLVQTWKDKGLQAPSNEPCIFLLGN
jgi:16S rRNA (cytidine1402-2'-O)-methyltransferase